MDSFEGYHFLVEALSDRPKQIAELVPLLTKLRPDLSEQQAEFCIKATLNLGLIEVSNKRQLIPTKLHGFFQSGSKIYRCLRCEHLSLKGEQTCPECAKSGVIVPLFPLHFCRACGEELAGVTWDEEGKTRVWDMDQEEGQDGSAGYILPTSQRSRMEGRLGLRTRGVAEKGWLSKKGREGHVPVPVTLDVVGGNMDIGRLNPGASRTLGALTYYPFRMCPACGVLRTEGRTREMNKLTFVTKVGRSTAVNILTLAMLGAKPDPVKPKSLVFCDVRQDAALQAGNMDDWYSHVLFRIWLRTAPPLPVDNAAWDNLIGSILGAGASNERHFLELLRDNGLPLPTRHHYGLPEDSTPIAEIDFLIGNVHVLVDGSIHQVKWVQEVDAAKREALQFEGYTILDFDMRDTTLSLQRLRELL